jgi:hypothetical protein
VIICGLGANRPVTKFLQILIAASAIPITATAQYYTGTVVAGVDFAGGKTGKGAALPLWEPYHIFVDSKDNLYIADFFTDTAWRVTPAGLVDARYPNGGANMGVAADDLGNVYILAAARGSNLSILRVTTEGVSTFLVDNLGPLGEQGSGLALDSSGNLYLGSFLTGVGTPLLEVSPSGKVSTILKSADAVGVAWHNGLLYFSSLGINGSISSVDPSGNVNRVVSGLAPGVQGLAFDANGNLFVAAEASVLEFRQDGTLTTVAGNTNAAASGGDGGLATAAGLADATEVAFDSSGVMYIAELLGGDIRKVAGGIITTAVGKVDQGIPATQAPLVNPWFTVALSNGDLFIQDESIPNMLLPAVTRTRHVLPNGQWSYLEIPTAQGSYWGPLAAVELNGTLHLLQSGVILQVLQDGSTQVERNLGSMGNMEYFGGVGGLAADPNGNYYVLGISGSSLGVWKSAPDGTTQAVYDLNYARDGHAERQSRSVDGLQS